MSKSGKLKGKSRTYPQLRFPSDYVELAGKKASIYEMNRQEESIAFIIRS